MNFDPNDYRYDNNVQLPEDYPPRVAFFKEFEGTPLSPSFRNRSFRAFHVPTGIWLGDSRSYNTYGRDHEFYETFHSGPSGDWAITLRYKGMSDTQLAKIWSINFDRAKDDFLSADQIGGGRQYWFEPEDAAVFERLENQQDLVDILLNLMEVYHSDGRALFDGQTKYDSHPDDDPEIWSRRVFSVTLPNGQTHIRKFVCMRGRYKK